MQTKTPIQPEMVPDHYWMEEKGIEILLTGLEEIIKGDFEEAYEIINALNVYLERLGVNLEFKKGKEVIRKIENLIDNHFKEWKFEANKNRPTELALYEVYSLVALSLVLGFNKFVREINSQHLIKKIESINWKELKEIYKDFPPSLLERLEFIQRRLSFEWDVEGNFISPKWYIRQLIIGRYLELFKESVDETLSLLNDFFVIKSEYLLSQEKFILAAFHSHRALELINKIEAHQPYLKTLIEELNKTRIEKELKWVNWEWQQIDEKLSQVYDKLVENLARCLPSLSLIEFKENFPDLFGQTYSFVCQDCFDSMLSKKATEFKNLFPLLNQIDLIILADFRT